MDRFCSEERLFVILRCAQNDSADGLVISSLLKQGIAGIRGVPVKSLPMRRLGFSLLLLPFFALHATAQKTTAVAPISSATAPTTQITLGNSTVVLGGLWKFHTGDNMAWAQPGFDDSAWVTMDLTPLKGSHDPFYGSQGYLPGWTARGYKGYYGYAWYRLRVHVQDGQTALALQMPIDFDDAYQVYVNGQFIGQTGRFTARGVTAYFSTPAAFPLPANFRGGPVTIAIRVWMKSYLTAPDAGGLHGPPVLGHASAIAGLLQLNWDAIDHTVYGSFVDIAILLLALGVAFGLFWLDRTEPAFLWLGLTCAALLAFEFSIVAGYYTTWIGDVPEFLLEDAFLTPAIIGLWVLFWAYWFRMDRMGRLHRAVWGLVALLAVGMAMMRGPFYGDVVPVHAIVWLSPLTLALKLLLGALLVWVTTRGIRKNQLEGLLALPAVVLVVLSIYEEELLLLHVPIFYFPFRFGVELDQIATILSLAIITVLMLRRFLHGQREREQFRLEMEQARQVQQMLIPEALPVVPGFTLESEYRPAQQVGGDFFQIIAGKDNSILIVVGDVSGKGLKAAMLVSLIVGAIRMVTETTQEPITILQSLNRRLCGRMQGHFATCVVARIAPNGETVIANAGHLPPYLNGAEVAIAGSLPLGMIETADFEQTRLTLQPGDRLTLLTDGVVEAQNEQKQLFGFDRTQQISRQPAAAIAVTAQQFGQEDDITVIGITRAAV
ncbi:MAG TPA: SpoIIE family protein phosphatase [Acidobacteriaceae bacterium]|jgi:hypothetical protein|nr:SpoIIE family protein phosphatase [Acidobacteriaceae bacterium]